ncbi:peptide/nickel transport system permease protein [Paenibacillus sp. UNCCL117]|uniref:ABC transporter permease n=1 Tax=unclassified Paenibacillus TaxID=185978 RepID=UPI000890784B|nr:MULTISPECIES: ABC transporter permease [unclassified Paenibacillus]SDD06193.1 peptide/nickel transport system permease protein [Paenibacillus sp. cl123]SFW31744.1 peptide/nickel transport system permease protein [Paenibacillus sp. UNCCL117]
MNVNNYLRNKTFVISCCVLLPILVVAAIGPWIIPHDPLEIHADIVLKPSLPDYPLGTDEFGRDILSRLILGIRPSLTVALGATLLAFGLGLTLGIVAGYFRGLAEKLIMRCVDILLCFPPILLALMVVGFWGAGVRNLIIIIGVVYAPHFARIAYSSTLQIKKQEFVESELSLGASHPRVMFGCILPNIMSPLIIQISLTVAAAILLESGLSFLGLGVIPPEPSWGQMIGQSRGYISLNPMYAIWPSLCLGITILAINLLGDSLRDILDPKLNRS